MVNTLVNFFKKRKILSYALPVSAIVTIVAMILYILNASSGVGSAAVNAWAVVCFVVAIVLELGIFVFADKIPNIGITAGLLVAGACLTVVVFLWLWMAVPWAENVWFLSSVLEPDPLEVSALNSAVAGIVVLGVGALTLIVGSIPTNLTHEE